MNSLFKINLKCVILTSQIEKNKKYVLTKTKDKWDPPTLELNSEWDFKNFDQQIIQKIKNLVFVNDLELLPQIISIKPNTTQDNSLDVLYGFIINYTESLSECDWLEFDLLQEKEYSGTLFEVIQKLT